MHSVRGKTLGNFREAQTPPLLRTALVLLVHISLVACGSFEADSFNSSSRTGNPMPEGPPVTNDAGTAPLPWTSVNQKFSCARPAARGVLNGAVRRLTKTEITQSLTDIFGSSIVNNSNVQQALALMPGDPSGDEVKAFQPSHAAEHAQAFLATAEAISDVIMASTTEKSRFFGSCATSTSNLNASCVNAFLQSKSPQVLRHALTAERQAQLVAMYNAGGGGEKGLRFLLMSMLQAPEFVFHVELGGGQAPQNGRQALDSYEVASRISYSIIGSLPDSALLADAAADRLRSLTTVRGHVERLLQTAKARSRFEKVMSSWLLTSYVQDPNPTLASRNGIDGRGLGAEAQREILDYVLHMVFDRDAKLPELLSEPVGFPRSSRMASLYASAIASGNTPVPLAQGHAGLVARVATLLTTRPDSSPIMRGVYVRRRLLCDAIPSPDFSIIQQRNEELGTLDPTQLSGREIAHRLTSAAVCVSCHNLLNPIGFSLEAYDPMGRSRSQQMVYNETGDVIATHSINTQVAQSHIETGAPSALNNSSDLVRVIAGSSKARACITERFVAHHRMRMLGADDGCALSEVEATLANGSSVKEAYIKSVVNEDILWRRGSEGG